MSQINETKMKDIKMKNSWKIIICNSFQNTLHFTIQATKSVPSNLVDLNAIFDVLFYFQRSLLNKEQKRKENKI